MLKKRLEILISDDEYLLLREKARQAKCSMGELVRESIREKYFAVSDGASREALKKIASGELALPETVEWGEIEEILDKRYEDETD